MIVLTKYSKLRPHQIIGIKFLYDCTMGMKKSFVGNGCILADDMGLGKSIQAITLLWTLLKQGPTGEPAVKRACVVSPSSLVGVCCGGMSCNGINFNRQNWTNELKKWLGDRIKVVSIAYVYHSPLHLANYHKGLQLKQGVLNLVLCNLDKLTCYVYHMIS